MLKFKLLLGALMAGLIGPGLWWPSTSLPRCASAQESQPKRMNQTVISESPIACNLTALNKEQRKRHQTLTAELRGLVQEIRELPDGYALRLPADEATIQKAAEWITLERRCCPFLAFTLEVGRESGPLSLSLTGREGVKPFLKTEFGIK